MPRNKYPVVKLVHLLTSARVSSTADLVGLSEVDNYFELASHFQYSANLVLDAFSGFPSTDRATVGFFYLYRHSVELQLKGLVHELHKAKGISRDKSIIKLRRLGHSLEELKAIVLSSPLAQFMDKGDEDNLIILVEVLTSVDPDGITLRYPNFDSELFGQAFNVLAMKRDFRKCWQSLTNLQELFLANLQK